jgi:amino acid transporter
MRLTRTLGTLGLVAVMYFQISGGPFTTEVLVAEVGPGMALLVLALMPLLWALPEALIIGELSSMLPLEGGYYAWVKRAFGPFWAFQNGWITWCYSLVDMALYPLLFTNALAWFLPEELTRLERWGVALAMIWTATLINLRGAGRVGATAMVAGLVVLSGFGVMAAASMPQLRNAPWVPFTVPGTEALGSLGVGLSLALWNYIGWDNASTVEGEIRDPGRTYPRALAWTFVLVVGVYFLALLPALSATDWRTWTEGSWPEIARATAGPLGGVIAPWIAVAGLASAFALFNAYLLTYSRIPLVVAVDGLLPAPLARTDARGIPRTAVWTSAAIYSGFALLPLQSLVVADVLLYAAAVGMEFLALIHLRRTEPALRGAFRLPLGWRGIALLAVPPMLTIVAVAVLAMRDGELGLPAVLAAATAVVTGPIVYRWRARKRVGGASDAMQ